MRLFLTAVLVAAVLFSAPVRAANDIAGKPWVLDTAGAGLVVTGTVRVACIRWVSPGSAISDRVILQDASSRTVWEETAPGLNFSTSECMPLVFEGGIKAPTLASGKVYIYVQ